MNREAREFVQISLGDEKVLPLTRYFYALQGQGTGNLWATYRGNALNILFLLSHPYPSFQPLFVLHPTISALVAVGPTGPPVRPRPQRNHGPSLARHQSHQSQPAAHSSGTPLASFGSAGEICHSAKMEIAKLLSDRIRHFTFSGTIVANLLKSSFPHNFESRPSSFLS